MAVAVHTEWDEFEYRTGESFDQYNSRSRTAFDRLLEAEKTVDTSKSLVGCLYSHPVADGYAWYVVTSDRPLTLRHIPIGDAWTLSPATVRGLSKKDIILDVMCRRFWDMQAKENK
jgi:hypothetical protein